MYNETYLTAAIFSALLVYLLDYAFGQPGNEKWNDREFLSNWSYFLAVRRLKKDGAWKDKHAQLMEHLSQVSTEAEKKMIRKSFRQTVFAQARELFYWEKALGMCPICFHFWITLFLFLAVTICFQSGTIITFIFNFMISHFLIRLLKKFV